MKLLSAVIFLGSAALPALAGGPAEPPVEPMPVAGAPAAGADWTGFYVGLAVSRGTFFDNASVPEGGTDGIGVHAGYLHDLGRVVVGGELSYASGSYEQFANNDWDATRLKLIAGFDAGRILPYAFVGQSQYNLNGASNFSDTVTVYGLGAQVQATERITVGLEYMVENKDDFDNNFDLENQELALKLGYRF